MARVKPSAPKSAFESLKPSQQVVVAAFTDPRSPGFLNKRQAYKVAHPRATMNTAAQEGVLTLNKPHVRAAVAESLSAAGITKDDLQGELKRNFEKCWTLNKMSDHREAVFALAKLMGLVTEKRETKTLTEHEGEAIRQLVSAALQSQPPTVTATVAAGSN